MSQIFLISDLHFGHKTVCGIEGNERFSCEEERSQHIEDRWNALVSKRDTVWVLGDVAFNKEGLSRVGALKGVKKLVLGNHDRLGTANYLEHFNKCMGSIRMRKLFVCSHQPLHPMDLEKPNRHQCNIHGHLHKGLVKKRVQTVYGGEYHIDDRYINVCCERTDFQPVTLDQIVKDLGHKIP